ncbi:hypothetical protein E8E13_003259 [Curvularia kusanoi]|uniref:Uncharacterized protein n=1 Tax=Curvularia kusanoi TaxID=90978 RepID=A0A9P4T429_CURKU|nr:hypothetical protein E8E13_003259 [Curvularia kusanoi]
MSKQADKLEQELTKLAERNNKNEQELHCLDDFIKKRQAEVADFVKRLATLHEDIQSTHTTKCFDKIKEIEGVQVAFFEKSMALTECYAERARRVRALMQGRVRLHELYEYSDVKNEANIPKEAISEIKDFSVKTSMLNRHLEGSLGIWTEALTSKLPKTSFIPHN